MIVDKGITKEQSKALQGLAILMMLYHHLFSTPEALGISYTSLLNINGINVELKMAWFFKLCVGIYAFVSGYGLCKGVMARDFGNDSFVGRLKKDYIFVLKKLLSLYTQYWLVFVFFVPIGFIAFGKQFVLSEFILNFLGVESTYNGAWWYMLQYLKMLLFFPILDCLFIRVKDLKNKLSWIITYALIIVVLVGMFVGMRDVFVSLESFMGEPFLMCFIVGYILARFHIYELCRIMIPKDILYFLGVLGLILVIVVRVKIAKDASSVGLDFIFVPVLAFGFSLLMDTFKKVSKFFMFFGGLSTYMWLTHVFFYDHYAKKLVMLSRFSTGIFVTLLILSFLAAIALEKVYAFLSSKIVKKH